MAELGRVVRSGGRLFLVTLGRGGSRRTQAFMRLTRATGIFPAPLPSRGTLLGWLGEAGFTELKPLGGSPLIAIAATRR